MKKTIFLLIVMFVLTFTTNAQNDTMYIIKQGNILGKYKVSDVDSVIFYKPSTSSSGTITGTASVCINGTPPVITFTGKDGIAPYTFIYKINDGAEITTKQTANGKDTIMIKAPTDKDGVFKYTLVKVKDASNTSFFKDNLSEITITVNPPPHAALDITGTNGATPYDPVQKLFVNCGATITSPQFNFVAVNASTTITTNTGYIIDWGDGSAPDNLPASFTIKQHLYNSLGFFEIKITANNNNAECKTANTIYKFFNGNSPSGNLASLGNYSDCAPYTVKWPVQNTASNAPGTTYEFTVDDATAPQIYDTYNLPDTIEHTFIKSSCGSKDNKYTVSFTATNPCDKSVTTLQVLATEKPTADFIVGSNLNLNNTVRFTNVSRGIYIMGSTCNSDFDKTWTITPNTGWTGTLSNSNYIDVKFNTAGEYQVKLKIEIPNTFDYRCSTDSITKIITINP